MATDKTFAFGGDAGKSAEWSVRLSVYIKGQHGFVESFVVNGANSLLIGRPILVALEVKTDYAQSKVWTKAWKRETQRPPQRPNSAQKAKSNQMLGSS